MRKATNKDLGITWFYWLPVVVFLIFGLLGLWLVFYGNKSDRSIGIVCSGLFLGLAICTVLWPVLRKREKQGVEMEQIRVNDETTAAFLFPASKTKHYIGLIGSLIMGLAATGLLSLAENAEHRVKGFAAAVLYAIIFGILARESFSKRHGILLTPLGIVWRQLFTSTIFVPWDAVGNVFFFSKKAQYSSSVCFGLNLVRLDSIPAKNARKKLEQNFSRHGCHLFYLAESLAVPVEILPETINFYKTHSASRNEIGTMAGLERVQSSQFQI